jgi:hypothetical protein
VIVDGRALVDRSELRGEVVVVGAGPAGIVTALELADAGLDVILIESGEWKHDPRSQRLGDAELVDAHRHAPSSLTNRRQVGGTSVIWGGRCVPFDPVDFDRREHVPDATWPVAYDDLTPHFARACEWLVCGRPVFDAGRVPALRDAPLVPDLRDGDVRTSDLERWSLPTDFGREYGRRLRESPRVRLVSHLTCTEIRCAEGEPRVRDLVARTLDGRTIRLRARRYVLACGGLETTRLLLASRAPGGRPIGDHAGHLGRWYMAHVEGGVARVRFGTPARATQYSYARDVDGVYVRRRLSFTRDYQRREQLPNIVGWLANPELSDARHASGPLSAAYLALVSPLGPAIAPDAQRRSLTGDHVPGAPYGVSRKDPVGAHARNVARDVAGTLRFLGGFGVQRFVPTRRAPGFFDYSPANAYPLQYHGEHLPNRDSRVTLTDQRDALGLPRLKIDLRFRQADVDGVVRAHERWDAYLRAAGVGALEYRSADVAADVWARIGGGFHQSGTTRMAQRPQDGVVDPHLAVHGFDDLYVASSSTFVTSSQANSTFMIVAFALRLVEHLKRQGAR